MQITAAVAREKFGPFSVENVELTDPRPDELLVKIIASGMCQTDQHGRDGYYNTPLPAVFGHEGAGVVMSQWRLELPADPSKNDPCQFGYDTISDVILHLRYTAREGGGLLRDGALTNLKTQIDEAQGDNDKWLVRLFSIRHEFPTEWAKFKSVQNVSNTSPAALTLNLRSEHYPFWSQGRLGAMRQVDIFTKTANSVEVTYKSDPPNSGENKVTLTENASYGNLRSGKLENDPLPAPTGKCTLYFNDNSMEDLWLALAWGK